MESIFCDSHLFQEVVIILGWELKVPRPVSPDDGISIGVIDNICKLSRTIVEAQGLLLLDLPGHDEKEQQDWITDLWSR